MSNKNITKFVDLKVNGRIFPSWVLHNFKQYKLPEIMRKENEDPCNVEVKLELRKYQLFIGRFIGPGMPYTSMLLYHGLGSGKTATSINLMNILYNYDHNINFIILIKASLQDDPWMKDLKVWLGRDPSEANVENISKLQRYSTIHFVHYDSPFAEKSFLDTMKKIDLAKPILYIIDEAHNFIRNVYSNINSKFGKRARVIYDYILKDKKENRNTRVLLISATPGINTPFELALMFNLLRPGIFPSSEEEFNKIFITESNYPILNPLRKNLFERRILGLVSYYIGSTPDLYAKQILDYITLPMSEYQYNIYRIFEKIENEISEKNKRFGRSSQLYRTYTRQASNFVFPYVSININGELRPRPNKFRISEKIADDFEKGKALDEKDKQIVKDYFKTLEQFVVETEKYFNKIKQSDEKTNWTIQDDLRVFKESFIPKQFLEFYQSDQRKSDLLKEMYKCSPKMTAVVFISNVSPGKVMVYSNYVLMEGIELLKMYFRLIGYNKYTTASPYHGYCEYHGRITPEERINIKNMFNGKNNIYGEKCKIILLSPSATEGIQLYDIRQEHILEPYWTEVRIQQVIGRGIRQCSHKDLPLNERVVNIYRYKVVKPENLDPDDKNRESTDQYIEDAAKAKANLIESFLSAMKEAAVDCELFKAHNMMTQSYTCFKFPQTATSGPAYKEDIRDDVKYDSGLYANNATVERIKVLKISAVYLINENTYSDPDRYWYDSKTGMVYDYETHYPIGRVEIIDNVPNKLDKNTYIISNLIDIPNIGTTVNP